MSYNLNENDSKLEPFKACVRIRPYLNSEKLVINNIRHMSNKNIIQLEDNNIVKILIKFK